jgi:hypothetical protein
MKSFRIMIGLTLFLSLACALPANAIGVYGQWQDSKDADSDGYGLGLKHEFGIIPLIGIEARASWLRYSDDDSDANLDMYPLEAFGKVKLGMFYGGVGLGYYIMSGDYAPDSTVGGFAAVGIDISLLGLGFFGELRYLYLEPDMETGGSVDMSGVGANLGVTLPVF